FRNIWSWGRNHSKPSLRKTADDGHAAVITASHPELGDYDLFCDSVDDLFFTENESNAQRLWGIANPTPFVKDSINDHVVNGKIDIINSAQFGTKAAAHYKFNIPANETISIRLRLSRRGDKQKIAEPFADFDEIFSTRRVEADEFYESLAPKALTEDQREIQRQAFAGLLWNKQFYHYIVEDWLDGDPGQPSPTEECQHGRDCGWRTIYK